MDTEALRAKVWALLHDLDMKARAGSDVEWYHGGVSACMTILGWLPEQPKPCPFCGTVDGVYLGPAVYKCRRCGAIGPSASRSDAEALTAWNTRKDTTP